MRCINKAILVRYEAAVALDQSISQMRGFHNSGKSGQSSDILVDDIDVHTNNLVRFDLPNCHLRGVLDPCNAGTELHLTASAS